MSMTHAPKLALAAALSALAIAPAAFAAPAHQLPASHHAKQQARNALTRGAWTPMVDESRLEPPFTGQSLADYAATLAWLHNRP